MILHISPPFQFPLLSTLHHACDETRNLKIETHTIDEGHEEEEDDPGEVDLGYEESVSSLTGEDVWSSVEFEVGLNCDICLGRNKRSLSVVLFF